MTRMGKFEEPLKCLATWFHRFPTLEADVAIAEEKNTLGAIGTTYVPLVEHIVPMAP